MNATAVQFDARAFLERYFASMWEILDGGVEELRKWVAEDNPLKRPA